MHVKHIVKQAKQLKTTKLKSRLCDYGDIIVLLTEFLTTNWAILYATL